MGKLPASVLGALIREYIIWYFAARFSARSRLVVEGREDSAYLLSPAKVLVVLRGILTEPEDLCVC